MHNPDADQSPFNTVPPIVVLIAGAMAAVEMVFQAGASGIFGGPGAIGWRLEAVRSFGFLDPVWDWMIETAQFPPEHLLRFLTYPFIHAAFTQTAFAVVIVLALGKAVGEVFSATALLVVFILPSIFGAVVYGTLLNTQVPLFGGYPGAFGLLGAFTFLLWINLAAIGANQLRAFTLIGVLMGIRLVYGLLFGSDYTWISDFSGFVCGFGLTPVLAPGGWQRILAKIRER